MKQLCTVNGVAAEALFFVIASAVMAVAGNLVNPQGIPWMENRVEQALAALEESGKQGVSTQRALLLHTNGAAVFLDSREPADFERERIPGAINTPITAFDLEDRIKQAPQGLPFIAYCSSITCDLSHLLAETMDLFDLGEVFVYAEGLEGWKAAGGPLEKGDE